MGQLADDCDPLVEGAAELSHLNNDPSKGVILTYYGNRFSLIARRHLRNDF
jgi:hypothetical protein